MSSSGGSSSSPRPRPPSPSSSTAAASASSPSVPAWASLVSGSVAGCVSRLVIAPLDVLKIRMQIVGMTGASLPPASASLRSTLRSLLREEGWTALWKGNWAAEAMVVPYAAVAFASYSACKEALRRQQRLPASWSPLLSGSVSGLCATMATYPLDLLRTRFAAQHSQRAEYASLPQAVRRIVSSDGLRGLYRGLPAALLGIVPMMAVQFQVYEACKGAAAAASPALPPSAPRRPSALQQSSCGFVSGVVSKLVTMPLDVIKKRCQVQRFAQYAQGGQQAAAASLSLRTAAVSIWRSEGLLGLYRGSLPSLLKAGPNAAVLYLVYEQSMSRLLPHIHSSATTLPEETS